MSKQDFVFSQRKGLYVSPSKEHPSRGISAMVWDKNWPHSCFQLGFLIYPFEEKARQALVLEKIALSLTQTLLLS